MPGAKDELAPVEPIEVPVLAWVFPLAHLLRARESEQPRRDRIPWVLAALDVVIILVQPVSRRRRVRGRRSATRRA